jgi:hypothetical protein
MNKLAVLLFAVAGLAFAQVPSSYPYSKPLSNCTTTGTTQFKLVKLSPGGTPAGCALIMATTDTTGYTGIAVSNAGTSGTVWVAFSGLVPLVMDATATAGDYVTNSATTAGDGEDAGSATYPTTGIVVGRVQAGCSNPACTAIVDIFPGEMQGVQVPLIVNGIIDGQAPVTITTGTTGNLGAASPGTGSSIYSSGYTFNQEGTAGTGVTYTLPATVKGKQYCVQNSGTTSVVNTGVLTVYPPASSYVILNGVVNTVGGGGTHGVASGGAAGDGACFVAIDATHWEVFVGKGTWTEN